MKGDSCTCRPWTEIDGEDISSASNGDRVLYTTPRNPIQVGRELPTSREASVACLGVDDDHDYSADSPAWLAIWGSLSPEGRLRWLDYELWEYFHLPRILWKTDC